MSHAKGTAERSTARGDRRVLARCWSGRVGSGQSNLYVYVLSDPISVVDPTGLYVETGVDLVSLALSRREFFGNLSLGTAGWVGLDVLSTLLPFVPALGSIEYVDDVAENGKRFIPVIH